MSTPAVAAYHRYHYRLDAGLCPQCGGKRSPDNGIKCDRCLEIGRHKHQLYDSPERRRQYGHTLYWSRNKQGLCPVCGQDRDDERFKLCTACREYLNERVRMSRANCASRGD